MTSTSSLTFVVVVLALQALRLATAAELEQFPELIQAITDIMKVPQMSGPEFELFLNRLIEDQLEEEIVESLLYPIREWEEYRDQCIVLAINIWYRAPDCLRDRGDLFVRYLELMPINSHNEFVDQYVAMTLSESSLSATDSQGRSPLELSLEVCLNISRILAEKSPEDTVEVVRRRALDMLHPRDWADIFYKHNKELMTRMDDFHTFCDASFGHRPGRRYFEIRLVLTALNDADVSEMSLPELLPNIRINDFLQQCRSIFLWDVAQDELRGLHLLSKTCERSGFADTFLEAVPFMFTSRIASQRALKYLFEQIDFNSTSIDQFAFQVVQRILLFHANHDESVISWLITEFQSEQIITFIALLTNSLLSPNNPLDVPDPEIIVAEALATCLYVQNDPQQNQLAGKIILALTLSFFSKYGSSDDLPEFNDRFLRDALLARALLQNRDPSFSDCPALHKRAQLLLPERLELKDDLKIPEYSGHLEMRIRNVTKLEDEYEISTHIGGRVYRARTVQDPAHREVAIKIQDLLQADSTKELEFMSRFCHRDPILGLVALLDLFQHDNRLYIVMELIEGVTLGNWLRTETADRIPELLISFTFQALTTLDRIHSFGWVHGDQSDLNNWMIDSRTGTLLLIDFGHAAISSSDVDRERFRQSLFNLIDEFKQLLNVSWYDPGPELLQQLEQTLTQWPYWAWNGAGLLTHSIFDDVRYRTYRSLDHYRDFPVLSGLQSANDTTSELGEPVNADAEPIEQEKVPMELNELEYTAMESKKQKKADSEPDKPEQIAVGKSIPDTEEEFTLRDEGLDLESANIEDPALEVLGTPTANNQSGGIGTNIFLILIGFLFAAASISAASVYARRRRIQSLRQTDLEL